MILASRFAFFCVSDPVSEWPSESVTYPTYRAWPFGPAKKLTNILDRIQRYVCRVIRPDLHPNQAQFELNLSSLEDRRLRISEKCANQMAKNPIFSSLFKKNMREASRSFGQYLEPKWNRKRYGFSSIPFFCRLMNEKENQRKTRQQVWDSDHSKHNVMFLLWLEGQFTARWSIMSNITPNDF